MKDYQHPRSEDLSITDVLDALSDPVRLSVVRCLSSSETPMPCGTFPTTLSKSTMSHHMRVLRQAGLIHIQPEGTQSLITLRREDIDARFPGVLDAILNVRCTK